MKGKVLTKHRNLPTKEQDDAMSDYVNSLNLDTYQHDEEGYSPFLAALTLEIALNTFVQRTLTLHSYIESIKSSDIEQPIPTIQSLHHSTSLPSSLILPPI